VWVKRTRRRLIAQNAGVDSLNC